MAEPAVVVLAAAGHAVGRRVVAALSGARLHGRGVAADETVDEVGGHLRALFAADHPIIGICAAGILVRALAPVLNDKREEPPVLAISADGASVVPLLGGHRGANRLAVELARVLGGHAALTTASEVTRGVAVDAPPAGWSLAATSDPRAIMARLRDGASLVVDDAAVRAPWLDPIRGDGTTPDVEVTVRRAHAAPVALVPKVLALGVGCERGLAPGELAALVDETLAANGLSVDAIGVVVSLDLKRGEPAVLATADRLGVPARFFDAATLERQTPRLANPSAVVFREVGCHGVAEAAALAAVGAAGRLVVAKVKGARATVAVAQAPAPLEADAIGIAGGRLWLLGLGPGGRDGRTREVDAILRRCAHLVGYHGYLDLIEPEIGGERHGFPLGGEVDRCRHALDLARAGHAVGLVGSGDVGVYAMAALVHEIAAADAASWSMPIEVIPGVSAMHTAAARAGAPLGHDFCAVSLSDLLTPWAVIEQRLEAAAAGDFVVALYNPVSRTRRAGFARACDILRSRRPPATPCVIARQLGRRDERVEVTTLAALDVERVDMLSIVLVGSGQTRRWTSAYGRPYVFTPRGYRSA